MKHKEMSRILKAIDAVTALACLALAFLVLPPTAQARFDVAGMDWLYLPFLAFTWVGILPFVALAVIAWGVFSDIGRDNSFSLRNAARLRVMGYIAACDTLVWLCALVFFAWVRFPASVIIITVAAAIALCVILAVVCVSLSHLTAKAALLKAENDLTV
ncbi:MAG: DUF2975 domain-containing protein [Coriobacteriaceae bacterium]|jgi:hypothetical protein|nr:DUF2975 domain-containing protein [Coriobacteriaceae bacterium]